MESVSCGNKMAEAAVDRRTKFFCHQCAVEINPKLPEFTCPECESGFIEELPENGHVEESQEEGFDPAQHFAELWGRTFLDNFRLHAQPTDDQGETSDGQERPRTRYQTIYPRTRMAIRRGPANAPPGLDGFLQQLLGNLAGGALIRGGIPIGMFNLHGNPGDYAWGPGGLDNVISQLLNQLEGSGAPPADKDEIGSIPTVTVTKEHVDKQIQCSVCMEDFKVDELVKQLQCHHCYHESCIVPWLELHGTCPVCRKTLNGEDVVSDTDILTNGDLQNAANSVFDFSEEYD